MREDSSAASYSFFLPGLVPGFFFDALLWYPCSPYLWFR